MDEKDTNLSGTLNSTDADKSSDYSKENRIDDLDLTFKKSENDNTYKKSVLDEEVNKILNENKKKTEEPAMISKMGLDKLKAEEIKVDDRKENKKDLNFDSPAPVKEEKEKNTTAAAKIKKESNKNPTSVKTSKSKNKKGKKNKSRINNSIFGGLIIITVILTVSILLAAGGISVGMEYWGIGKSDNDISFNIPKGASNDDIADLLVENGIIKNKTLFKIALKLGNPDAIYPGDITLQPSQGYSGIITELSKMRESYKTVTVTFTEGENLLQVAKKLEDNGVCTASDFLFEFNKQQGYDFEKNLKENKNAFYSMEGFFFPDTYNFYVGDTAYNITKTVREHFDKQITDKMYERMKKLDLDLNEVMTLASIVQLESENEKEMPKVASVFLNRLNDPETFPMLQSDATKNYIKNVIKKQSDNQASIDHYTDYYDTYKCTGLPAGPVCNPGIDAINAVLYPAETDYYYFCNNLKTGKSYYAKTLEEHEKNLVKAGLK